MGTSLARYYHRRYYGYIPLRAVYPILLYGGGFVPHDSTVYVNIELSYVDGGEPVNVRVEYRFGMGSLSLRVHVYLDRGYDLRVNGEPIEPRAYNSNTSSFIAGFTIKKLSDNTVYTSVTPLDILILHLLERKHKIVMLILDEMEREKQRIMSERIARDYNSVINLLKWLRDTFFPMMDQIIDLSKIKNITQIKDIERGQVTLEAEDFFMMAALLGYIAKPIIPKQFNKP